jgi:hypothetical protein
VPVQVLRRVGRLWRIRRRGVGVEQRPKTPKVPGIVHFAHPGGVEEEILSRLGRRLGAPASYGVGLSLLPPSDGNKAARSQLAIAELRAICGGVFEHVAAAVVRPGGDDDLRLGVVAGGGAMLPRKSSTAPAGWGERDGGEEQDADGSVALCVRVSGTSCIIWPGWTTHLIRSESSVSGP